MIWLGIMYRSVLCAGTVSYTHLDVYKRQGVDSVFVGGRNLLPKATLTETISGVTFTPNPDGSVSVSGTATSDSYYTFAHYMERALLGQTVCLSGSSQLVTVVINERTSSATFVRNVLVDRGQGASGIVTKRKDSNVLYAVLQVQSGDTVNEVVYPMLNLGKSPLPYKPYQGSVTPLPIPRPLHKVGDVRDICCTRVKSVYDKRIVIDQNSIINMSGEASIVGTSRRFNAVSYTHLNQCRDARACSSMFNAGGCASQICISLRRRDHPRAYCNGRGFAGIQCSAFDSQQICWR